MIQAMELSDDARRVLELLHAGMQAELLGGQFGERGVEWVAGALGDLLRRGLVKRATGSGRFAATKAGLRALTDWEPEASFGFTGAREGMTRRQRDLFEAWLGDRGVIGTLHHGGRYGADMQAHLAAVRLGWRVVVHPSTSGIPREYPGAAVVCDRAEPLARNRRIVQASRRLFAAPATRGEVLCSGTWATVREARRRAVSVDLVAP